METIYRFRLATVTMETFKTTKCLQQKYVTNKQQEKLIKPMKFIYSR